MVIVCIVLLFVLLVGFVVIFASKISNLENENLQLAQSIHRLKTYIEDINNKVSEQEPEQDKNTKTEMSPYEFAENVMKGLIDIEDELRK